jgi:hypothetical protein
LKWFVHSYIGSEHLLLGIVSEGEIISAERDRGSGPSIAFQVLQNLGVDPSSIRDRVMQAPGFGEEKPPEQTERLSMQPYQEQLRAMLPPMSDRALQVWHAIGSQTTWPEPDVKVDHVWLRNMTKLTESELQTALAELTELGVITWTDFII